MKKYTTFPLLLTTDSIVNKALNQFSGLTATYCSIFNTTLILLGQEVRKNALGKPSFKKVFYHMCYNIIILKI